MVNSASMSCPNTFQTDFAKKKPDCKQSNLVVKLLFVFLNICSVMCGEQVSSRWVD